MIKVIANIIVTTLLILLGVMFVYNLRADAFAIGALEFIVQPAQAGYVDISGAVKHPGLYAISVNTRIADLVKMAGGLTDDADIGLIAKEVNLAQKLVDQDKIYLPTLNSDLERE